MERFRPINLMDSGRHQIRRRANHAARLGAALAAVGVLTGAGLGWAGYGVLVDAIPTSQALVDAPQSLGTSENILVMGLDSRLDEQGRPLPKDVYAALHAGDETVGGHNANVLIMLHIPGDGGPVRAVSIPRDDFVELSGCPSKVCKAKVKQAYGLGYLEKMTALSTVGPKNPSATEVANREQQAREAGRKAQIATVRQLTGVPIDHFVEVTLGAFYQIARSVEPITVCLNDDTSDQYSGANFHKGTQQLDAAQAMAFVRQRRDPNDALFTDLDRTRRQQAFIASVVNALRDGGALSDPGTQRNLLKVATQYVAVDAGLNFEGLMERSKTLTTRPLTLYTLPISKFGSTSRGEDVDVVDVPTIRSIMYNLVMTDYGAVAPQPVTAAPAQSAVLNIVNASNREGVAKALEAVFATRGFTPGAASTADALSDTSTIAYGKGANQAARTLADQFGLTAIVSDSVAAGTVQLTVGADFRDPDSISNEKPVADSPQAPAQPIITADASATGADAPAPTDLSLMNATGVVCVK
jgi:LCP family protein required for cell wall assembly